MRVLLSENPFPFDPTKMPWSDRGQWSCHWLTPDPPSANPVVVAYKLAFGVAETETVRIHVTADERYELWLNGEYIARGSERGDSEHWFFETYDLELSQGEHLLVAKVWSLAEKAPFAQITGGHGFLLCPQEPEWQEKIGTGKAGWQAKVLTGFEYLPPLTAWGTGHKLKVNGSQVSWGWEKGEGEGWTSVATGPAGMGPGVNDRTPKHILHHATLPPMREVLWRDSVVRHVSDAAVGETSKTPILAADDLAEEHAGWEELINSGRPLVVPANARKRVLIDLANYMCAYPQVQLCDGPGASVRIHWQESLHDELGKTDKGNRDQIEGKYFTTMWHNCDGVGDTFITDGGKHRRFDTLWWSAGRYVEILVDTEDEPLTIESLKFIETRYPYEFTATFECSEPRFKAVEPILTRVLEMCSHETYMDCPYYEQLQYVGDTRLQALVTYILTADDRLPRKAIEMFGASRRTSGLTQSRYPNNIIQIIPPFSLFWVGMISDYAHWRGDLPFVSRHMLGARAVLDAYRQKINADGLLDAMDGWNFVDWVGTWQGGMPKDASGGISSILNLQFAKFLLKAEKIENWLGEPEMGLRHKRTAESLIKAVNERFWSEERGLYANDLEHTEFSEHAQCLALLSHAVGPDRLDRVKEGLLANGDLDRATIYYSHYLFETFTLLGRTDQILERMPLWFDHVKNGLKTTIESPEPTRSDCHAWGAHPLFHLYASFLGIRPIAPGMTEVRITPQLGGVHRLSGTIPTPLGNLTVHLDGDHGSVLLPSGMKGELQLKGRRVPLTSGQTQF